MSLPHTAFTETLGGGMPSTRASSLGLVRIAIADDDPASLEVMRLALETPAHEIHEASTGAELVQLLARHGPFDVVVTDVHMPWTEGIQVMESARTARLQTPAVVVTGFSDTHLEARVAQLGNARLLRKPFGISELRVAVNDLLAIDA